ncbi:protein Abitram [Phlebotomus argentipes]|uniref:protein Abitram n=1 Tax=Phlebotomus argentipes TaxID=94469 RepID=UPI0028930D36|nr:protein Abitram [Phlebotomus argentipes]
MKSEKMEKGEDLEQYYYTPDLDYHVGDVRVPDITEEYDPAREYPSVVDRFYTRYYHVRPEKVGEDHLVLLHSNRICLIGLAPGHVAFEKGIASITYDIGNYDRSKNQVSGKAKKGGMQLQPGTALGMIKCKDESEYKIISCITGRLIEVNPRIVERPEMMKSEGEGYVAIVLPRIDKVEGIKASLLTEEQYTARSEIQYK